VLKVPRRRNIIRSLILGRASGAQRSLPLFWACPPSASAQSSAGVSAHPAFEVALTEVNRNPPSGARAISLGTGLNHGRLTFEAVTLRVWCSRHMIFSGTRLKMPCVVRV
jgi:hypothetical protein